MFASRLLIRLAVLVVALLGLWALFASDSGAGGPQQRYLVQPGDTLWSIAAESFGDPREGVWEIKRHNHLTSSTITPGQVLLVP